MHDCGESGKYRIGIYVRESRDDNEENYETIETQKNLLMDFAQKSGMGTIHKVYIDDNVSGSTFNRRGIEALKEDAEKHVIDLVLLKDLSRLGRNNAKTLMFLDFLEECSVRVMTCDGRYDSSKDNETVGIETWFNERYVRDVSKKIRANIRFKLEKGEYLGHAPYGYSKSKEEKNKLCVDPETAPFVKLIYEKYRQGFGYGYIAKHLDSINCRPPSEKHNPGSYRHWNAAGVRRILTNPVYIGDTVQGVSERISFKSKKTRKLPESKWIVTKDTHEPIIDLREFEEVQRIIKSKRNGSGPHKGQLHVLKGLMFCGSCGSSMFARVRKDRPPGYVCSNYTKLGRQKCTSHHIREDFVVGIIIEELKGLLDDSSCMARLQLLFEKDKDNTANGAQDVQRLEQLLIGKQKQQDILYMDKLEGKITEQLFIRMNANIENRIDQLRHEIVKAKSRETDSNDFMEVLNEARNNVRDPRITNEIVKLLVNRIIVYEEGDFEQFSKVTARSEDSEGVIVIEFNHSDSIEMQE